MLRRLCLPLLLALAVQACDIPPPERFVQHGTGSGQALDIGRNEAGEACTLTRGAVDSPIYCGTYSQPSGRVTIAAKSTDDPAAIARDSAWRSALEVSNRCGDPAPVSIAGAPGVALACTQRQTAYASVAMAVRIDGTLYLVDAVKPAEAVLGRAVAVLAGREPAVAAAPQDEAVAGKRLAEQDVNLRGVGAIEAVDRQLALASAYNQHGNYAAAELAYRTAVTLKASLVGPDNPSLAVPLAREALQLSNQRQFAEADRVFARARRLVGGADQLDPLAVPLVRHMMALDRLNRGDTAGALPLLDDAERGYLDILPPDALRAAASERGTQGRSPVEQMADAAEDIRRNAVPAERDALNGVLEVRRYRAVALALTGKVQDAAAPLSGLQGFYAGRDPQLAGRFYRTQAMVEAGAGRTETASVNLGVSVEKFRQAQPGSLPVAETMLLQTNLPGHETTLETCEQATAILLELNTAVDPGLLVPCLRRFEAASRTGGAASQAVLARMFAIAQLVQGNVTAQQISLASARMAENARNPLAASAIRARDEQQVALERLIRRRQSREAEGAEASELATIDTQITKAQADLREAERALQAAAPGYQQLVQRPVTAQDVLAALHPGEAVVATVLAGDDGWTLALADGAMSLGRIEGGPKVITTLVHRFRDSIEKPAEAGRSTFDTDAAQELYQRIFGGIADRLANTRTLMVAPSAVLLSIPFGALLTGPASSGDLIHAPYLIRRMAVLHIPSPASLIQLRHAEGTSHAARPWFGFGDPVVPSPRQLAATFPASSCGRQSEGDQSFDPLPGSRLELDTARDLEGAAKSETLLGPDFTAARVQAAKLRDYRILHFATHALLPGEIGCLAEPAILTSAGPRDPDARGALLTASQVAQLDLDADLVILSACNTGGPGGSGAGESLSGLARGFIAAGSRALLVTHWEENDKVTAYLLILFLDQRRVHPEEGLAASLAAAQLRMLEDAKGDYAFFADPRYWAVLALVGGVGN